MSPTNITADDRAILDADPRYRRLAERLRDLGRVAVAFSGGVDSTFLAAAARDVLGPDRVLLVSAEGVIFGDQEAEGSRCLADLLGLRRVAVTADPLALPKFRHNPPDRCYHCKHAIFQRLHDVAAEQGDFVLCDGSNADDLGDYRPGRAALAELGVRSPLQEADLAKRDVRDLSRRLGLPTAGKPSAACLASRVPYGTEITEDILRRIGAAEQVLRDEGFGACRVRHHDNIARIELPSERVAELAQPDVRRRVAAALKALGYAYVTLDLEGYRTGSLNEVLSDE